MHRSLAVCRWRRVLLLAVLGTAPGCAARAALEPTVPIPAPTVRPFADGLQWVLVEPLTFRLGLSDFAVTVPQGFVTDFASVPRAFWGIVPPVGYHSRAAILHDFLYWERGCTREEADKIFLLAMIASKVEVSAREAIYATVRTTGEGAWIANAAERAAGKPRVIPPEYLALPDDATWSRYRETLFARGVRAAPRSEARPAYCAAAAAVPDPPSVPPRPGP